MASFERQKRKENAMTNETTTPEPAPARDDADPAITEKKPVRKRPAKKAAKKTAKATKKSATKGGTASNTLGRLFDDFLAYLPKVGKSDGTVKSYSADLTVARKHFGDDALVTALTPRKITTYFASEAVTRTRSGGEKNAITVAKIQRVFRQAMEFAVASRVLDESPMPEKE